MIAGYLRVSTTEQANSGLSLEAQAGAIEQHAARQGATCQLFADRGASGSKRNGRPALAAMLDAAKRGELSAVVVSRLDRLARSTADSLAIAAELESAGVALVDLSCPGDISGAFGQFSYTLRAAVAELERRLIAERTRIALRTKRDKNEWCGGRPAYGLQQDGKGLAVDHERIGTVRTVFELRQRGLSTRAIADALNLSGIPTARGGRWHSSTVSYMLRNRRVTAALEGGTAYDGTEENER